MLLPSPVPVTTGTGTGTRTTGTSNGSGTGTGTGAGPWGAGPGAALQSPYSPSMAPPQMLPKPIMAPPPPLPAQLNVLLGTSPGGFESSTANPGEEKPLPPQPGQEEFYRRPDNWPGRGYLVKYVGESIHRKQETPFNIR